MGKGRTALLWISLMLHAVWVAIAVFLFFGGPFRADDPPTVQWLNAIVCPTCESRYDAISNAASLGRLDLIALSLTVLGTVLAIGAFMGFFLIRGAAIHAAAEEAEAHISKTLPGMVTAELLGEAILSNDRVRLSLNSALQSASVENQVDEVTANRIAEAMGENGDDE